MRPKSQEWKLNAALCLRWSEGGIWKLQRGCQAVFESIWKASCCIWKSPQGRASLHSQKSPWTQVTKSGTTPCCYSFINVEYNVVNHHWSHLQGLILVFHDAEKVLVWCDNCDAKLNIIVIPAHPALSHRWSSEQLSNPLSRTTECNLLAASICQRFHRSIWSTRHQRGSWKCSIVLTKHVQSHRYTCQRDIIQILFWGVTRVSPIRLKKTFQATNTQGYSSLS